MPGVSLGKKDGTWTLKQSWREGIKLNIDEKMIQKKGCNPTLVAQCKYKQAGEPDQEENIGKSGSPTLKKTAQRWVYFRSKQTRLARNSE